MRTKSWPFWDDWKVIFDKDRATGRNTEGVVEAVTNSSPEEPITEIGESSGYHPSFEYLLGYEQVQATFGNYVMDDSSAQSGAKRKLKPSGTPKRSSRKGSEDDNGIVELLGKLHV